MKTHRRTSHRGHVRAFGTTKAGRLRTHTDAKREGLAALEMALVMPLIALMLLGVIEFGALLFVRHSMLFAANEAARELAVRDGTVAQARQVALDRLSESPLQYTVTATLPDPDDPNDRRATVEITTPVSASSLDFLDMFGASDVLRVQATMRKEG